MSNDEELLKGILEWQEKGETEFYSFIRSDRLSAIRSANLLRKYGFSVKVWNGSGLTPDFCLHQIDVHRKTLNA